MMKINFRYLIVSLFIFLATNLRALADQQQDPALIQSMISKYTILPPQIMSDRHFFLELGLQSNLSFNEPGLQAAIGYRAQYFGFDVRFTKARSSYGEIVRLATHNEYAGSSDNTEIDIARNKFDKWSHWSIGPGFSVSNQFTSGFLTGFTERVRAGFELGNYNDDVNNIPFRSYIFNIETSILYQINPSIPWSLIVSLSWNSGMLVRDYGDGPTSAYGLPVSWVGSSIGLEYTF